MLRWQCNERHRRPSRTILPSTFPLCILLLSCLFCLETRLSCWEKAFAAPKSQANTVASRRAVGLGILLANAAQPAGATGATEQIVASKKALDKLRADECWTRVDCNGDDIRRVAGTVGTVSPLFKIKDALMEVYVDDPPDVPDLEDVLQHLSQLDYQAYCTIFAINGGPESFRKHGFVRYLLRIAIHRESAFRRQSSAVSLTRSLRELFGSHLQKAECNAAENQFTLSIHTSQVQHLQLSWEPFMRAVFVLYANQGYVSETQEELRMGEASLVSLFSDAGLLGSGLQRATTRSIYQSLTDRRHFQTNKEKICFQGQAEVRRRIKKEGMGRSKSLPPKIQGLQPCVSQLTAQASALHFEDFQEVCLAAAMYRNPNLVVPVELRFEQFLMAMVDGLKHRMASKTEMLPHLMVEAKSIEEAEAKQRAWNELLEALEGCTMGVPDEKWGRRMRATRQLQAREATVKEDEPVRRSRSAPPAVSLPSRFQTILGIAKDSSQSTISALNAAMPTEGSLEGLGLPVGSRLESVVSVMKVAKRFGAHIDVAEVKKKRSDIGKGALDRRRKVATLKVKFLADRQIRAAVLKREQLSQEIQPEG